MSIDYKISILIDDKKQLQLKTNEIFGELIFLGQDSKASLPSSENVKLGASLFGLFVLLQVISLLFI